MPALIINSKITVHRLNKVMSLLRGTKALPCNKLIINNFCSLNAYL